VLVHIAVLCILIVEHRVKRCVSRRKM